VNTANQNIETTAQLLMNYRRNVQFNLESTNSLKPPIGVPELAKSRGTK
jgi:DASH complex subunit Dad4